MLKMINLIVLFVIGIIAKHTYGDKPEAIVGGYNAVAGQFKYQISLRYDGQHVCGGTLIDKIHVVTAAHCVNKPESHKHLTVVTGALLLSGDGESHKIKCIRVHPDYTGEKNDGWKNDIAVITLERPIKENNFQCSIALASRDYATGEYLGAISGWGKTSVDSGASSILQWTGVKVLSQANCLAAHPKRSSDGAFTNPKQICTLQAVGIGACSGDSGGPLVINGELCGVISWVALCAKGVADVFTNVYYYLDFIKQSITIC